MGTHVYIDGFNLYYGAVKGTPYKWLDLEAMVRRLLPDDDIDAIHYFTARLKPTPDSPHAPNRQHAYLRALETRRRVRTWISLPDPVFGRRGRRIDRPAGW